MTDDVQPVAAYLRGQCKKLGVISVKLLQPFPEAEVVAALSGKKAVTVLEPKKIKKIAIVASLETTDQLREIACIYQTNV